MSEEQKLRKKGCDQTKAKRLVNIGETFQRWRDLREVKGMKTNEEVAKFLLDRWVSLVAELFTEAWVRNSVFSLLPVITNPNCTTSRYLCAR